MKKLSLAICIGAAFLAGSAGAAEKGRAISYVTSWGLPENAATVLGSSKVDTFLLSFGKWNADGSIETSDDIATVPEYNAWYLPGGYNSWTQLKLAHPEKKMMIAFGGQTYEEIWGHIDTPEKRTIVAQGLANLLETPYPVYKKGMQPNEMAGECLQWNWNQTVCDMGTYQKAGTVYLDGIDFDFEKAARISEKENSDLLALVTELRGMIGSEKQLSLTTYHVGADPENCADNTITENCSYIEHDRSSHNGEVKPLLQNSKDLFNFFNVMTYDAGPDFKYKTAMANYAAAVGEKSKIILGTTINAQWGPAASFVETKENNLDRAQWQASEGYGGFFTWALGSNTQNLSLADQSAYINEMKDKADTAEPAVPAEDVTPPVAEHQVDLSISAGLVKITLSEADFKGKNHFVVKRNGRYAFETKAGTYYYTSVHKSNGMATATSTLALKSGDVITVELYPYGDNKKIKLLSSTTVTEDMIIPADISGTHIDVSGNKITVTSTKDVFAGNNRILLRLNGKYLAESYAGKSYYSQSAKAPQGQAAFSVNTKLKAGDVITADQASGEPGMGQVILKTLNTLTVK